ncbi:hypothetical protein [Micromonospora sp. NBC_01796]|uniref:hypothetical protein n=1 Tax=Micromonospora sp. NBC_01796 TaxID=2975987 RepID=UPI002DD936E5|nr:hypothetical protein [Micromonospora sp. NBC_01796]WSA87568.1 hypothetical protein OIE47_08135 [Micromonospora sp. NBC_01796]
MILDDSALRAYVAGQVAVGELIAEIADEDRQVGVPAACLASAYAATTDEVGTALLALLMTTPAVRLLPLGVDPGGDDVRQTGTFARAAGDDLAAGHAIRSALAHQAHYVTAKRGTASAILPNGWGVIDLGEA